MSAVYTRLRSGDWGLKITGDDTCAGEVVAVRKSNGSTTWETVQRVIYQNDDYSICTIAKPEAAGAYSELEFREGLREPRCKVLYTGDRFDDADEQEAG